MIAKEIYPRIPNYCLALSAALYVFMGLVHILFIYQVTGISNKFTFLKHLVISSLITYNLFLVYAFFLEVSGFNL